MRASETAHIVLFFSREISCLLCPSQMSFFGKGDYYCSSALTLAVESINTCCEALIAQDIFGLAHFFPFVLPPLGFFWGFFLFVPECAPQAFSIPLSQVIANDRTHRQRQDGYRLDHIQREEHKDSSDLVSSILQVCARKCWPAGLG